MFPWHYVNSCNDENYITKASVSDCVATEGSFRAYIINMHLHAKSLSQMAHTTVINYFEVCHILRNNPSFDVTFRLLFDFRPFPFLLKQKYFVSDRNIFVFYKEDKTNRLLPSCSNINFSVLLSMNPNNSLSDYLVCWISFASLSKVFLYLLQWTTLRLDIKEGTVSFAIERAKQNGDTKYYNTFITF